MRSVRYLAHRLTRLHFDLSQSFLLHFWMLQHELALSEQELPDAFFLILPLFFQLLLYVFEHLIPPFASYDHL